MSQPNFEGSDEDCIPPTPSPVGRTTFLTLRKSLSSSGSEDEPSLANRNFVNSTNTLNKQSAEICSKLYSEKEGTFVETSSFSNIGADINELLNGGLNSEHVEKDKEESSFTGFRIDNRKSKPNKEKDSQSTEHQKEDDEPQPFLCQTDIDEQVTKKLTSKTYRLSRRKRNSRVVSNPLKSSKLTVSVKKSPEKLGKFKVEDVPQNDEENGSTALVPMKYVLPKSRMKSVKRSATKGNSPDQKRHQSHAVIPKELKVLYFYLTLF